MGSSSKIDVIVAGGEPAQEADALADVDGAVETVDVAPDPARRIIILAPTKQIGIEHAETLGIDPVAIATPRSSLSVYGVAADQIIAAPGLTAEQHADLMVNAAPCLATSKAD